MSVTETEPLTVLTTGPNHTRLVYQAKGPVADLEQTLKRLFQLEGKLSKSEGAAGDEGLASGVAIVSSSPNNSFIVSGPPAAVEEVRELLEKLDQTRGILFLEMEIGEVPGGSIKLPDTSKRESQTAEPATAVHQLAERPANMVTIGRVRLTTLDNQQAFAQLGSRVTIVSGSRHGPLSAGPQSPFITVDIGLILRVQPLIGTDRTVVMNIDVEKSQLAPENEGTPIALEGKLIRAPRIDATSVQTTITARDGQTVILGTIESQSESGKELLVIVTPHIVVPADPAKTPTSR